MGGFEFRDFQVEMNAKNRRGHHKQKDVLEKLDLCKDFEQCGYK